MSMEKKLSIFSHQMEAIVYTAVYQVTSTDLIWLWNHGHLAKLEQYIPNRTCSGIIPTITLF